MRLPSAKSLAIIFGDNARHARAILEMSRTELFGLVGAAGDAVRAKQSECYFPCSTLGLKLLALNALGEFHGIEAFELRDGTWCYYLNSGDTYTTTLLWVRGSYRVGCWGDVAEKHAV